MDKNFESVTTELIFLNIFLHLENWLCLPFLKNRMFYVWKTAAFSHYCLVCFMFMMCKPACVFMYTDTVNISFSVQNILFFFMFLFHYIHMMLSTLFPGDLLKKLGKFITTLYSNNSSSDCFHTVLNIPCPIIMPSIGSLFTWMAIHFCPVFGYDPLSYFTISIVFSPMFHHCSLHLFYLSFLSYWLCISSSDFPNGIMILWDDGTELISTWLPCSLVFWEMSVNLGHLQVHLQVEGGDYSVNSSRCLRERGFSV